MQTIPLRKSVKVLLLNDKNELLLMCADDPKTTNVEGKYHGRFWFPIGGKIELNETIEETAIREIFEETGIPMQELKLGPIVWFGKFELILNGTLTNLHQTFLVAKTSTQNITLNNLTADEQLIIQNVSWFSLDKIQSCSEIIYPVLLKQYISDIMSGIYPATPIEIDLAKQPQ